MPRARAAVVPFQIHLCTECSETQPVLISTRSIRNNAERHMRRVHALPHPFVGRGISSELTMMIGDVDALFQLTAVDAEWHANIIKPFLLWQQDDTLALFAQALLLISQLLAADATAVRGYGAMLFAIFPKCVLRANRKGTIKQTELRARLENWLHGKWQEMLQQADAAQAKIADSRRRSQRGAIPTTRPTNVPGLNLIKKAADAIKRGYPGQALDILNRTGLVANAQDALRTKWSATASTARRTASPTGVRPRNPNDDSADSQTCQEVQLSPTSVFQTMKKMARKTSLDVYGWNAKHILAVWCDTRTTTKRQHSSATRQSCKQARDAWLKAVEHIAATQMLGSHVGDAICRAGVILPLQKKPGSRDVRPIVITPMLRRIVCGALQRQCRADLVQQIETTRDNVKQLALSTNGLDKLVKIITLLHESQADTAITLQIDIANAYNTIRREAAIQAMADCAPKTGRTMRWLYPAQTSGAYTDNAGVRHQIATHSGVYQGCPLSTAAFCAAFNTVLTPVGEQYPTVQFLAYADDLHLVGPPEAVAAAYSAFCTLAHTELDLSVNPRKCRVWAPTPELAQCDSVRDMGLSVVTDGLQVVGVPVGTVEFQTRTCTAKLTAIQQRVEKLKCLAGAKERDNITPVVYNPSQLALRVIWQSASAMLSHLQRNVAPSVLAPIAIEFDQWIKDTFEHHICTIEESLWPLLTLPFRKGGLALTSAYATMRAAFVGSWAATLQDTQVACSSDDDTTRITSVTVQSPLRDWYPQWRIYFNDANRAAELPCLTALLEASSHYNKVIFLKWNAEQQSLFSGENPCWTDWWNDEKPTLPLTPQYRHQSMHSTLREVTAEAQSLWLQGEYSTSPLSKPGRLFWQATQWPTEAMLDKPGRAILHDRQRKGGMLAFTALPTYRHRWIYDDQLIAHIQVMFGATLVTGVSVSDGCQAQSNRGVHCGHNMYRNGRHALNCTNTAVLHVRHETTRNFVCNIMQKHTDLSVEIREKRRFSERRGHDFSPDAEVYPPGHSGKRPVALDFTMIDPAVQTHACVGLSVNDYQRLHAANVIDSTVSSNGTCSRRTPCGEGCHSMPAQGPAAVSARLAEHTKREKYGQDTYNIRRDARGRPTPRGMDFVPFAAQLTGSFGPSAEKWLAKCAEAAARRGPPVPHRERKRLQALLLKQWHEEWIFGLPELHRRLLVVYHRRCRDTFTSSRLYRSIQVPTTSGAAATGSTHPSS